MIKLAYPEGHKFIYATKGSAGFDICANENAQLLPGNWQVISTGLYIVEASTRSSNMVPEIQIRCRSGLACRFGIVVLGGVATIDSDYRGEIKVALWNAGKASFTILKGDRIAQGICAVTLQLDCLDVLDVERGDRGFGSTGIK